MHVIRILRDYLGLSQAELAKLAGLTQADLSEMEHMNPYGKITKYKRLCDALGTSLHSIVMNDPSSVPLSFFDVTRQPEYNDPLPMDHTILGRNGEELALKMERDRLKENSPVLSHLVLPYFKMKVPSPGYDILSYKDNGTPIYIEVKTTENKDVTNFQLTNHEYDTALKLSNSGATYLIYLFTAWGTVNQNLKVVNFADLIAQNRVSAVKYLCNIRVKDPVVSGIVHFRKKLNLSQIELSERTGIPASTLCKYEQRNSVISVDACIKLSKFFNVPVDELLQSYTTDKILDFQYDL